ncbi:hypothetical protein RRF57_008773 [Xylaria bambusicola]|uniref:Uncharacterized protein n=1 Tax=Xylaria bambusicola TaxID=326684 RepID=A0AAN7UIG4_9PEZI
MHSAISSATFSVQTSLLVNFLWPITTSDACSSACIVIVGECDLVDLVSNLKPCVTAGRDWEHFAADPVHGCSYNESSEEVNVVDVLFLVVSKCYFWLNSRVLKRPITAGITYCSAYWHITAINSADESHNVDQDTGNIAGVCAPIDTERKEVRAGVACVVEFLDSKITAPHEVIIANHDASDGAQEDRVC